MDAEKFNTYLDSYQTLTAEQKKILVQEVVYRTDFKLFWFITEKLWERAKHFVNDDNFSARALRWRLKQAIKICEHYQKQ